MKFNCFLLSVDTEARTGMVMPDALLYLAKVSGPKKVFHMVIRLPLAFKRMVPAVWRLEYEEKWVNPAMSFWFEVPQRTYWPRFGFNLEFQVACIECEILND